MRRQAGFTMVELIMVMVMIGVLAAIGVPKLMGENTIAATVFGDQVASALRHAQKSAVAHRRLVCVSLGARTVAMQIRIATTVPTGTGMEPCGAALQGVEPGTYDSTDNSVSMTGAPAQLYFRPDGTISGTPAGTPLGLVKIGIQLGTNVRRTISVQGSTGYVE